MDTAKIWIKTESRRRRIETTGVRIMSDAITRAIQPAIESIDTYAHANDAAQLVPEKIKREEMEKGYLRLYEFALIPFARRAFQQIEGEFKQKNVSDLETNWMAFIQTYVTAELAERVTGVTGTLRKQLRTILQDGISQGLSVEQLKRDIDKLGLPRIISNRSRTIARTEIINASNKGNLLGAQSTGVDLEKVWITSLDGLEREGHAEADGQTVELNDSFIVNGERLQYPGDPNGSASNVINCRCVEAFIPKE